MSYIFRVIKLIIFSISLVKLSLNLEFLSLGEIIIPPRLYQPREYQLWSRICRGISGGEPHCELTNLEIQVHLTFWGRETIVHAAFGGFLELKSEPLQRQCLRYWSNCLLFSNPPMHFENGTEEDRCR